MVKLHQFKLKFYLKILYFIIAIVIVYFVYPKEGKFKYEFQKGSPWMHESLYAPFNFAIYKTDNELVKEKDSIKNNLIPYFTFNDNTFKNQIIKFSADFEAKWKEHDNEYYRIPDEQENNKQKLKYYNYAVSLLKQFYDKGIIDLKKYQKIKFINNSVFIIKNNLAEEFTISDIYNINTAKKEINNLINTKKENNNYINNLDYVFLNSLNLDQYIKGNLDYDKITFNEIKQQKLDNISITYGFIQKNELVVSKGELIDQGLYRILSSLKKEYEEKTGNNANFYLSLGRIILITISFLILFLFIINFKSSILYSNVKTLFMLLIMLSFISLSSVIVRSGIFSVYVIPFALISIIITTFYDARTALFIHLVTVLMVGFIVPNSFEFVIVQIFAGVIAILSISNLYKRQQIFISAFLVFLTYIIISLAFMLIYDSSFDNLEWKRLLWFGINSILILASAPIIYIFEKTFGFLSDLTLMELSDSNQPLLRKLAEHAPGTFQHSMQVANLAEDAIRKIGGNPLLVRCGALYHDIGKLKNPQYFIENQLSGVNPHDKLEYEESAKIIISHVTEGIKIGKKYNLPHQIIEFIPMHHGTTKAYYFYKSFLLKYPDKEINLSNFSYPGPTPNSKESVVLMMADSIEAASRTAKVINEDVIEKLVNGIVNNQMENHQYDRANINFNDIEIVKSAFAKKLLSIYHARIEYPK